jgi:hypothetical protein
VKEPRQTVNRAEENGASKGLRHHADASHAEIANADMHQGKVVCDRRSVSINVDRCKENNDFTQRSAIARRAGAISAEALTGFFEHPPWHRSSYSKRFDQMPIMPSHVLQMRRHEASTRVAKAGINARFTFLRARASCMTD